MSSSVTDQQPQENAWVIDTHYHAYCKGLDAPTYVGHNKRLEVPTTDNPANLITSIRKDGHILDRRHSIIVDMDIGGNAVLLPSSTSGNYHLIIDKPVVWKDYVEWLEAGVKLGIVDAKWLEHSKRNECATIRFPGAYKKGVYKKEDV